ncbi:hypothetical protein GC176_26615 [bacterium]|nr:hypothetical protein [bacterium]
MTQPLRTACWLAAVVLTGAVGGLVASIAPPRLRLIGLFAVALGASLGWLAGLQAVTLRMPSRRIALIGGLLTGTAGYIIVTLLNWQSYARELQVAEKPDAGQALVANMLKSASEAGAHDAEAETAFAEFRDSARRAIEEAQQRRNFGGFLMHRAAKLHLSRALAVGLWGVEILLAAMAAAFVAVRPTRLPYCSQCEHFLTVSRTHRFNSPVPDDLKSLVQLPDLSESAVTVRLLRCRCPEQTPRVQLEIADKGSGRGVTMTSDCSPDEVRKISRLLDNTEGLSAPN